MWWATGPGGAPAALKFVSLGRTVSETEWRSVRLMREVRLPYLIAVHGAWEVRGYLVTAMEPADGSLADRLRECADRGFPGLRRDELLAHMEGRPMCSTTGTGRGTWVMPAWYAASSTGA